MVMRTHHAAEQEVVSTPEPDASQVLVKSVTEEPAANDGHQAIATAVARQPLEVSPASRPIRHPVTEECDGGEQAESSDTLAEAPYAFPTDDPEYVSALSRFRSMSSPDLLKEVRQLRRLVSRKGVTDYALHRATVCAAAFAMNERGSGEGRCPAPAFRAWMPVVQAIKGRIVSPQDGILASDRRVIDLHWLALNGRPEPREEFRNLFIDGALNFSLANEFAASKGSAEAKGKLLGLTALGELPLGMVQSKATRNRWAALCKSRDADLRKIRDALLRPSTRTTDDAELLWDIFAAHELTGGVTSHIVDLVALMGHGEIRREQVPRKTKWLCEMAGVTLTVPSR
ncbi:MAG TPA: hypothetical protein PLX20_00080 [Rhodocyclaceae bacterium]|nr:hypothetical protein [Rhodocyclaceae bacterium]HNC60213.1 hypothetical protein [Rhodocyclaceae bacterium]HNH11493.1 hypothetical protein [Rhodocyclaceae bacterium]